MDHSYHSSDERASNFDSHSQSPDDHLEDPSTMSFTTDTVNKDEESSSLIDDKLDLKNDATGTTEFFKQIAGVFMFG